MKINEKHKQMNRTKSVDLSQSLGRADMERWGEATGCHGDNCTPR